MTDAVIYSFTAPCAEITLNRGDKLNIFSEELVEALHSSLNQAELDQARYIVFRASGRAFSAGLDLSNLASSSDGDILYRLVRIELLLQRVRHASYGTIALVHGNCYGAAADLVLACRHRIATSDTRFLMPGIRFGIVLGTRRLRDTVGENNASQLLDRSAPFKAKEAYDCGFITAIADQSDWPAQLDSATSAMLQLSALAYEQREKSLIPDTRDYDMAALVRSIASGSIKQQMLEFVDSIKTAKK